MNECGNRISECGIQREGADVVIGPGGLVVFPCFAPSFHLETGACLAALKEISPI